MTIKIHPMIDLLLNKKENEILLSVNSLKEKLKATLEEKSKKLSTSFTFYKSQRKLDLQQLKHYTDLCKLQVISQNLNYFMQELKSLENHSNPVVNQIIHPYMEEYKNLEQDFYDLNSIVDRTVACLERIYRNTIGFLNEKRINLKYVNEKVSFDTIEKLHQVHSYFLIRIEEDKKILTNLLNPLVGLVEALKIIQELHKGIDDSLNEIEIVNHQTTTERTHKDFYLSNSIHFLQLLFLYDKIADLHYGEIQKDLEILTKRQYSSLDEKKYLLRLAFLRDFIEQLVIEKKVLLWSLILQVSYCDSVRKLSLDLTTKQLKLYKTLHDIHDNDDLNLSSLAHNLNSLLLDFDDTTESAQDEIKKIFAKYIANIKEKFRCSVPFEKDELINTWCKKLVQLETELLQAIISIDHYIDHPEKCDLENPNINYETKSKKYLEIISEVQKSKGIVGSQLDNQAEKDNNQMDTEKKGNFVSKFFRKTKNDRTHENVETKESSLKY